MKDNKNNFYPVFSLSYSCTVFILEANFNQKFCSITTKSLKKTSDKCLLSQVPKAFRELLADCQTTAGVWSQQVKLTATAKSTT